VETLLYVAIISLALALRWWQVGATPLSDVEAQQSLLGLGLLRGEAFQPAQYSPLLASLQGLTFLLFGDSDASARLASVLLGTLLIGLIPLTLRRHLGPVVCLLTSALLTLSPVALYFSRTVNAEIAVAGGALLIVAGFFNWADSGQRRWLFLLSAGLALMLTAGSMVYSMLLIFAGLVLIRLPAFQALWRSGAELAAQAGPAASDRLHETSLNSSDPYILPNPAASVATPAADEPDETPALNEATQASLGQAGILLGVLLLVLSTAALFNLTGFGVMSGAIGDWLSRFSPEPRPDAGFNGIFLLTVYEPLLVFSGLIGLTLVIMRGNLPATVFGGWFIGALLLDTIMSGRPNSSLILVVVPLAFLAAIALAELWQAVQQHATWSNEGILALAGLVIFAFIYIGLTAWLERVCGAEDTACQYLWLQPLAGLILLVVIIIFFALLSDVEVALRGAALAGVALGLLFTLNIAWRLNYGQLMHLPYQPLVGVPAATELVALSETLAEQSERRAGDATLLDVTVSGVNSPALLWRLRDYRHLRQGAIEPANPATAIITPPESELNLDEPYVGQEFALNAAWSPVGLPTKELVKWLIYREAKTMPTGNHVVLWLKLNE
jgi:uncharacterized protein (TIGR03663 family)